MLKLKELEKIKQEADAAHSKLVAVTKTRSNDDLKALYDSGHRLFGENRVQELLEKKDLLASDIEWHLIGHLQTNKVKYIANFISMIHSVDSIKLLKEINKQAKKNDKIVACLLQFHVAQEESKFGIPPTEMDNFMAEVKVLDLSHVKIKGIMGLASFVDDKDQVRKEFKSLNLIYKSLKNKYFRESIDFNTLSMGMSGDYKIALEEGGNLLRIGSSLFN
jgi:hypothetical protein